MEYIHSLNYLCDSHFILVYKIRSWLNFREHYIKYYKKALN